MIEFMNGFGVAQEEKTLHITVLRGVDLKAMDWNNSDPYAKVTCNRKEFKTRVIKGSLNPEWNEKFEIDVTDPEARLMISIWDRDLVGSDDYMGAFEVRVGDVGEGTELQQLYRLMDLRQKGFFGRGGGKVKQMDGGGQCELKLQWLPRDQEDDVDLKRRQKKGAVRLQVSSERRRGALRVPY